MWQRSRFDFVRKGFKSRLGATDERHGPRSWGCHSKLNGKVKEEANVNKAELIAAVAEKADQPKAAAADTLNALAATISEVLKAGERVGWTGFGTFSVTKRAARKGRNPATGKAIKIKASRSPRFKAGKTLKDSI